LAAARPCDAFRPVSLGGHYCESLFSMKARKPGQNCVGHIFPTFADFNSGNC
jgi:hypothetical protein